ncbi:MAG: hypothetical protein A2096_04110 [Spirochaetes bacterium GWF1_41_5]|nr:MAG: hypothetical protein A2096_04110 [Spirochaetes bacterium GWF1_41_5]
MKQGIIQIDIFVIIKNLDLKKHLKSSIFFYRRDSQTEQDKSSSNKLDIIQTTVFIKSKKYRKYQKNPLTVHYILYILLHNESLNE